MRNGNSLTERLDGMHINWSIETRAADGSVGRVDFKKDGVYVGSVNGLGNVRAVAELVVEDGKDLFEAIESQGGWRR